MHRQDEIIIAKEITAGNHCFRLEEFWEEDGDGYCVSDYILAKHTRLRAYAADGRMEREYDLDSLEYDKDMWLEGGILCVRWQPAYNETRLTRIDAASLSVIGEEITA